MTPREYAVSRVKDKRAKEYFSMMVENEGYRPKMYTDTKGKRTIGVGLNLEEPMNRQFLKEEGIDINEIFNGRELNDREIKGLYNRSLQQAFKDAAQFDPNFASRPEEAKKAIVDMSFNLGLTKLKKFKKMNEGLQENNYSKAADEMVDSEWYKDVKSRGPRTVKLMRSLAK